MVVWLWGFWLEIHNPNLGFNWSIQIQVKNLKGLSGLTRLWLLRGDRGGGNWWIGASCLVCVCVRVFVAWDLFGGEPLCSCCLVARYVVVFFLFFLRVGGRVEGFGLPKPLGAFPLPRHIVTSIDISSSSILGFASRVKKTSGARLGVRN